MIPLFIITGAAFLWAGCIIAISFMEAWLKFRAPGVSVSIGLGIGKLVFAALNKMEWVFAALIIICYLFNYKAINASVIIWFAISAGILLLQTIWLLPALDTRAAAVIKGETVQPSSLHYYFVFAEFLKIVALIMMAWHLYKVPFIAA